MLSLLVTFRYELKKNSKMKALKDKVLCDRLFHYGLAAGTLLTLSPLASGQLVWSDVQNIFIENPTDPYELDMNGDGTDDFILGIALSSTYWNQYSNFNSAFIRNARTDMYANCWMVDVTNLNDVQALESSQTVSLYKTFMSSGNTWNLGSYDRIMRFTGGNFPGEGFRFIGVRVNIGAPAMPHFGWIRVSVPLLANNIMILDWCYEASVEEPIITGGFPMIFPELISSACNNSMVFNLDLIFDSAIENLGSEHFNISNGEVTNIQTILPGLEYRIEITAYEEGMVYVELGGQTITSVSGDPVAGAYISTLVDLTPPVITIDAGPPMTSEPVSYVVISTDEPVDIPEETDIQVENGMIYGISPLSPTEYEITVVALAPGTVTITLLEGALINNCGLSNAETSCSYVYSPEGLDIHIQSTDGILIYPNPTNNQLYIELDEEADINIFDMTGLKIHSRQHIITETIDISHFPKGLYMVCITGNDKRSLLKKVIIE